MEPEQRVLKNGKILSANINNFEENINERRLVVASCVVGCARWDLIVEEFSENGVDYLSIQGRPDFEMTVDIWPERLSTEMAICVKNGNPERWEKCQGTFEVEDEELIGWKKFMRMDTVLDPNSGFLRDDGSLMIQFEIRLDVITADKGNRLFNFFDPFEGSVLFKTEYTNFYVSKQLLMFHSPVIAEQLADGRGEVVTPDGISCELAHVFLQLIHGVKIEYETEYTLDILYLAHKYQVLTVLRQMEVYFKILSDHDINCVDFYSNGWPERVLSKNQFDDLQIVVAMNGELTDKEEEEELISLGRKVLLAITRAPFTNDLDPPEPEPEPEPEEPLPVPRSSSFLHTFFKSIKTVTGCL